MKKAEIEVGGHYLAKVSGTIVTVRVDAIRIRGGYDYKNDQTVYDVTNLKTGRKTTFRSAAKFRGPARAAVADRAAADAEVAARDDALASFQQRVQANLEEAPQASEGEESSDPTPAVTAAVLPTRSFPEDTTAEPATPSAAMPTAGDSQAVVDTVPFVPTGLAGRITRALTGRERGTLVAGMTPNEEQESILELAAQAPMLRSAGGVMVVAAGAGTGKTATLKMLEEVLPGRGQYTAFNSKLVAGSKGKFKKARCNTTHSLAFHAVGKKYQARLDRQERMRSSQVARILGIEPMILTLVGQTDADGKPRTKTLTAEFLAGQVLVAIRRFCQSADDCIDARHVRYIDGIDEIAEYQDEGGEFRRKRQTVNNDRVREYLVPVCRRAWDDLVRVDGQLQFSHDHYVKIWSLGKGEDRPIIAADYILLDEAQDTAPVFLDIIRRQTHALLVMVGDDNQQIYEWRGAVNAMSTFPNAPRRMLSQSYRFGQAIADVANTILAELDEPTALVMRGLPTIPSRVARVAEADAYLYRTNAGAVGRVMAAIAEGKRPHLVGGGSDVVAWCEAAIDLKAKRPTHHPELCCFESWREVVEYSKTDEGNDMRLMVKLIEEFGAEEIRDALRDMPEEADADMIVCTAHKSKGLEWDTVYLGPDFPLANRMSDADRRLLYVAATRAKLTLDVSECPPFCGGRDGYGEDARDVPGLAIRYTAPMPDAAAQAAWIAARDGGAASPPADPRPTAAPQGTPGNGHAASPSPAVAKRETAGKYTWAKWGSAWMARGPAGAKPGDRISVERRDGSTQLCTVRAVQHEYDDATIYAV